MTSRAGSFHSEAGPTCRRFLVLAYENKSRINSHSLVMLRWSRIMIKSANNKQTVCKFREGRVRALDAVIYSAGLGKITPDACFRSFFFRRIAANLFAYMRTTSDVWDTSFAKNCFFRGRKWSAKSGLCGCLPTIRFFVVCGRVLG